MFQFFKKNRKAREFLLRPAQELTVENVMDVVLKQDIKPDSSVAMINKNLESS